MTFTIKTKGSIVIAKHLASLSAPVPYQSLCFKQLNHKEDGKKIKAPMMGA